MLGLVQPIPYISTTHIQSPFPTAPMRTYLENDPVALFAVLSGILALVFYLSRLRQMERVFKALPPVLWAYFVPMLLTTAGLIPSASPLYDVLSRYILLFALFLLMVSVDVPAIARLGPRALLMMVAGTIGIVLGAPIAYAVFKGFLPENAWMGLAALSGSWIGGTANMLAVIEGLNVPADLVGPIIVVDTVVGYGWMGLLISLAVFEKRFDAWSKADTSVLAELQKRAQAQEQTRRPLQLADAALIFGITVVAVVGARAVAGFMPTIGDPVTIITSGTWAILLVVTAGLALSFTPVRRVDDAGASAIGYYALYLLLASIGAKADLAAVLDAPAYLLTGVLWLSIHIAVLILVAKLFKAPLFLVSIASMANVGGPASTPVVAGVYHPALPPVGLLLAIAGYILGIYASLVAATLLSWVA